MSGMRCISANVDEMLDVNVNGELRWNELRASYPMYANQRMLIPRSHSFA